MWLNMEIEKIGNLVHDEVNLQTFLNQAELDAVNENSTRFVNLKSSLLVPKHNKPVKILTHIDCL